MEAQRGPGGATIVPLAVHPRGQIVTVHPMRDKNMFKTLASRPSVPVTALSDLCTSAANHKNVTSKVILRHFSTSCHYFNTVSLFERKIVEPSANTILSVPLKHCIIFH